MAWIQANIGNLVVGLVLTVIVLLNIRKIVLDKKQGRHSCGGDCGSCGGCNACSSIKADLNAARKAIDAK